MGYPVAVGEFGAYSMAPDAARVNYLNAMRTEMVARNLPWMYWELASGFGLCDPQPHIWRQNLLDALLPSER
jgi:endoglucanase